MRSFKVFGLRDVDRFSDYHKYPFKGITVRILDEDIRDCDILYWEPLEPVDAPFSYYKNSIGHREFSNLLENRNIHIFVVYAGYDISTIQDFKDTYISNIHIFPWNTSLLHYSRYSAESVYGKNIKDIKANDSKFKKLFNCLNRGVRPARVTLLDELYKNGLFEYGDVSWNLLTTDEAFKDYGLSFKYWKEERLKVDLNEPDIVDSEKVLDFHLWSDYYLSSDTLFTIQSETIIGDSFSDNHFLSEKSWKPLILGKPYIMVGPPGYYKQVQKYGFKLYDELFDYSFDSIQDETERIQKIVYEISKLKEENYTELYLKIKDKVEYNRNLAISITESDEYISNEFINFYKKNKHYIETIPSCQLNMDFKQIFKNII
jgi:hypothetical protein